MGSIHLLIAQDHAKSLEWLVKDRADFASYMVMKLHGTSKEPIDIKKSTEDWATYYDRRWEHLKNWIAIVATITTWFALIIQITK